MDYHPDNQQGRLMRRTIVMAVIPCCSFDVLREFWPEIAESSNCLFEAKRKKAPPAANSP